jgi:hypothetical protein
MLGANVWRDCDLGVSVEIENEFKSWLQKNLPTLVLDDLPDEKIRVSNNLTIYFRWMPTDELADDIIERPYCIYEVVLNDVIGSSFFIREFEDNLSKTFVYERQEYSPSALRSYIIYGTHNEWETYFEDLEEHVKYKE